jgi:hypothetical protein
MSRRVRPRISSPSSPVKPITGPPGQARGDREEYDAVAGVGALSRRTEKPAQVAPDRDWVDAKVWGQLAGHQQRREERRPLESGGRTHETVNLAPALESLAPARGVYRRRPPTNRQHAGMGVLNSLIRRS